GALLRQRRDERDPLYLRHLWSLAVLAARHRPLAPLRAGWRYPLVAPGAVGPVVRGGVLYPHGGHGAARRAGGGAALVPQGPPGPGAWRAVPGPGAPLASRQP